MSNTAMNDKRAMLEQYLRKQTAQKAPEAPLPLRRAGQEVFPLSLFQETIWLHSQLAGSAPIYNDLVVIHRDGPLDAEVLRRTLTEIIRRHEAWRTTFDVVDGQPVQCVRAPSVFHLPIVDLSDLPELERETKAAEIGNREGSKIFDLQRGPLVRATLLKLAPERYRLLLALHHLVFDGQSLNSVFLPELVAIYEAYSIGKDSPLSEPQLQYPEFALWQREQEPSLQSQLKYWRTQLSGAPATLDLPRDHGRGASPTFGGAQKNFELTTSDGIRALSKSRAVTPYMVLLASLAALLYRYTGQHDMVLGTVTSNRKRPEFDALLGYFLNTLALRVDASGDCSFSELLLRVRETTLTAISNGDAPLHKVIQQLRLGREQSQNPFVQVFFSLEAPPASTFPGWELTLREVEIEAAKFDLYIELEDRPDGFKGRVTYNTDLLEAPSIARMLGHWETLIKAVTANPELRLSELPVLTEPERLQILKTWNDTAQPYPQSCLHQIIEQQGAEHGSRVAVTCEGRSLTYAQLNARANQVARLLLKRGVTSGARVGISTIRSLDMMVGLLGILKAGAAYVPMDPAYPRERLDLMQEDAQCAVLITQDALRDRLPPGNAEIISLDGDAASICAESEANLDLDSKPEDLAYVIYTSGSTGKPKGVQLEHRSLVNLLFSMQRQPGFSANHVLLAVTSISFDIAGLELYLPLISGARVVIAGSETVMNGAALLGLLRQSRATVMQATPTTWRLLIKAGWQGGDGLKVLCGGEALPPELVRELTQRSDSVWNVYGPTETTIWSTVYRLRGDEGGSPPIGKPIANTECFVVDRHQQPAPVGIAGELLIGGDGLARGYFNRPEETAAKFISHPFDSRPGQRLYRTGDLVRYLSDGNIEFIGRMDSQVKVRGFRIELGDIEAALVEHPAVKAAVAVVRGLGQEDAFIAAYVQLHEHASCSDTELLGHLNSKLPRYMLPSRIMVLEEFPLTPNGKVDRKALPNPELVLAGQQPDGSAPRTSLELRLLRAWEKVLGRELRSIDADFFALGGHSLLAAQLIYEVEQGFGTRLSMASVFKAPTVEKMAGLLRSNRESRSAAEIIPIQPYGQKAAFFCVCVDSGPMFLAMVGHLSKDRPFLGVDLRPTIAEHLKPPYDLRAAAEILASAILEQQPEGPYFLGGYCLSGLLAYETANVLMQQGHRVAQVAMFLTNNPTPQNAFSNVSQVKALMRRFSLDKLRAHVARLGRFQREASGDTYVSSRIGNFTRDAKLLLWQMKFGLRSRFTRGRLREVKEILFAAAKRYRPAPISTRVAVFRSQAASGPEGPDCGWAEIVAPGDLSLHVVPGNDWEIFFDPNAKTLAQQLQHVLDEETVEQREEICTAVT